MNNALKLTILSMLMFTAVESQAAISDDAFFSPGAGFGNGSGELFLSVVDRGGSSPESYVRDLGITEGAFVSDPSSFLGTKLGADSNLQSLLNKRDGGQIYWNLAAIANEVSPTINFGVLTTAPYQLDQTKMQPYPQALFVPMTSMSSYIEAVNQAADPNNTTDYAANNSILIPPSNWQAYYDGNSRPGDWLSPLSIESNNVVPTETGLGGAMGFYSVRVNPNTLLTGESSFSGQWTLATDGTLSYLAPVPLPGAFWLMVSSLIVLTFVGCRRSVRQSYASQKLTVCA